MFYHIKNTFDNIVKPVEKYVIWENKFTRDSKFSFKDYVTSFALTKEAPIRQILKTSSKTTSQQAFNK
ncbi:MAG: hypothetical protein IJF83_04600 [Methanobrevibacter sp.]|nr:hypothetical protein [Methanobrevibacter sp.]